jgi:hypothetical protein
VKLRALIIAGKTPAEILCLPLLTPLKNAFNGSLGAIK